MLDEWVNAQVKDLLDLVDAETDAGTEPLAAFGDHFWQPHMGADSAIDLGRLLPIGPITDSDLRRCLMSLLTNLAYSQVIGRTSVCYSRDRNFYSNKKSRLPPWVSYKIIMEAVRILAMFPNLVRSQTTKPTAPRQNGEIVPRSRLVPGPDFNAEIIQYILGEATHTPSALIEVRLRSGALKVYKDEPSIRTTIPNIERHSELIMRSRITIADPQVQLIGPGLYIYNHNGRSRYVNMAMTSHVRIFVGSLNFGGRLYRCWWQILPKWLRQKIEIDGQPVVEPDYKALHIRLLYEGLGIPFPFSIRDGDEKQDAYTIPGIDRDIVKRAVLILINAKDPVIAAFALAFPRSKNKAERPEIPRAELEARVLEAGVVIETVARHFEPIARFWCTGIGMTLQRVDSELMLTMMDRMTALGIPIATVHDSCIARRGDGAIVGAAMEQVLVEIGIPTARRILARRRGANKVGILGHDLTDMVVTLQRSFSSSRRPRDARRFLELLADIETLIKTDRQLNFVRLRVAAACIARLDGRNDSFPERVATAIGEMATACGLTVPKCEIDAAVEAIDDQALRMSDDQAARMCGVTSEIADRLQLIRLRPKAAVASPTNAKGTPLQKRKFRRMARGAVPEIVPVLPGKPWKSDGMSRSTWYKKHPDPTKRQALALLAAIITKNKGVVRMTDDRLVQAVASLNACDNGKGAMAVERLLYELAPHLCTDEYDEVLTGVCRPFDPAYYE
jgi:hypothetical protein